MANAQERGLQEALNDAEGLARVLRLMSNGKLDLQPVVQGANKHLPPLPLSWDEARSEATAIVKGGK